MLPAFTRSQNKTQRLFIQVMELLIYNIISLKFTKYNFTKNQEGRTRTYIVRA